MKVEYDLDILKPHMPGIDLVARNLMKIKGMSRVRIKVDELDQKTTSLHIKIEGYNITLDGIQEVLETMNCALHSVDEVVIEERATNSKDQTMDGSIRLNSKECKTLLGIVRSSDRAVPPPVRCRAGCRPVRRSLR